MGQAASTDYKGSDFNMKNGATLSSLLNQTFAELSKHRQIVFVYLAIAVPAAFVSAFFGNESSSSLFGFGFSFSLDDTVGLGILAGILMFAAFIVDIVITYWLTGALVRQSAVPGFDRFLPWLGIYILSWLGIMFGLVLLLVPGIILMVRWIAVMPVVIKGDVPAMDAFGDSWEMTRGYGWSVFGAGIILAILLIVVAAVTGIASTAAGPIIGSAFKAITESASTVLFTAFGVGAYRLLKDDSEDIAEIFG